jgi:hypothetical protein
LQSTFHLGIFVYTCIDGENDAVCDYHVHDESTEYAHADSDTSSDTGSDTETETNTDTDTVDTDTHEDDTDGIRPDAIIDGDF